MKLLLDQDVYTITERFLRERGFHVITAAELGLSRATDETLLHKAESLGCIFVTRDRDFGNLVFVRKLGSGVIYLRILPATLNDVHLELERVLNLYSETQLSKAFVVINARGHRIRKLPS